MLTLLLSSGSVMEVLRTWINVPHISVQNSWETQFQPPIGGPWMTTIPTSYCIDETQSSMNQQNEA